MLLLFYCFCYNIAHAETNQYGVDCALTPWYSSCQLNENSGEFINPQKDDVTEYNIGDDGYASVPLPFEFTLHDKTFIHSWMHSNGVISFLTIPGTQNSGAGTPYNQGYVCCDGEDIAGILSGNYTGQNWHSTQGNPNYFSGIPYISYSIAALWTDLIRINKDLDGDGVNDTGFFTRKIDTTGDGNFDTMRYYWRNISEYYNADNNNTFGVQIDNSNAIEIHYFDINIKDHSVTIAVTGDLSNGDVEQFMYYQNQTNDFTLSDITNGTYTNENSPGAQIWNFNLGAACVANPLINENCNGYAEAYAEVIYNQECSSDPLYDSGCPGYETAYYNQQCSNDPLYDSGCSGYAEAYYNYQCSANPLYDSGCSGYAEAYYDYQCSANPLYDSGCPGYETAYYNQQCTASPLYDSGCSGHFEAQCEANALYDIRCDGYAQAYYDQQCLQNPQYDTQCPGYVEPITEAPSTENNISTGDAVVDEVLAPPPIIILPPLPTPAPPPVVEPVVEVEVIVEPEIVETIEAEVEAQIEQELEPVVEAPVEETSNETREEESSNNVDEQVGSNGQDDKESNTKESSSEGSAGDETGVSGSTDKPKKQELTAKQKQEAKRKKMIEIITERLTKLADKMADSASLEAQKAIQAQINALINFVPGFNQYGQLAIPGRDFYQQEDIYQDKKIPENNRGLRNGLANQILHEKMVDEQYKDMK